MTPENQQKTIRTLVKRVTINPNGSLGLELLWPANKEAPPPMAVEPVRSNGAFGVPNAI